MIAAETVGKRMIQRMPWMVSKLQFRADKMGYLIAVHQGDHTMDYRLIAVPWYKRCESAEELYRTVMQILEEEKLQPYATTSEPREQRAGMQCWLVRFPGGTSFELAVAAYDHEYERSRR